LCGVACSLIWGIMSTGGAVFARSLAVQP